jgi:DNA-directed RNA polymerase specialized sigma24 family protein/ribosome-associated translation inhibitor RaiA
MEQNIEFKGFEPKDVIRKLIEELKSRVERKAKRFYPIFLRVMVERKSVHMHYHVSITLDVPGKTLAAKEDNHDQDVAIRAAFAEIERQLLDYKAQLAGESVWKRPARRQEIHDQKMDAPPSEADARASFFSLVDPHRYKLKDFVGHLLRWAEATGDLTPGELAMEDVVDAALLRAYTEFVEQPFRGELESWLMQLAVRQLEAEIKRSLSERGRMVHIVDDIPETDPAKAVSTLDDRILDLWPSDEDLKLEDVVPDLEVPAPEEETEIKKLRLCARATLKAMPDEWRQVLLLRSAKGKRGAELSRAIGKSKEETERLLEYARNYFRAKLIEAGCVVKQPVLSGQEKKHRR